MRAETPVDITHTETSSLLRGPMGRIGAVLLVTLAAGGCFVALPATTFRTHAVLVLDGGMAPLHATLIRVAAETAVSKPVIDRAAAMLLATDVKAPAPDLAERLSVTAGAKGATSRQARLAESIAPVTRADPGDLAGTLEVSATAPVPEEAARIADALAEAFVTQQDDTATRDRLRQDEKAATRVDAAKAVALAARQRLIALGGASLDPVQARNAAVAQTTAAETRLADIRAIMAAGSPPLSDRRDLPPALAMPQAAYLELKGQLAKQSETLGERHTTIIALQDGVKRAAATLSAEWNRLKKVAETEVVAAREHEAALRKGDTSIDTKRRDTIEEARHAVQLADEAVAKALKLQDLVPDEATFRLIARAPVPKLASGHTLAMRLTLSVLAGLAGLALVLAVRRLVAPREAGRLVVLPGAPAGHDAVEPEAVPTPAAPAVASNPERPESPQAAPPTISPITPPTIPAPVATGFLDHIPERPPLFEASWMSESPRLRRPARPPARSRAEPAPRPVAPVDGGDDVDLVDAMRGVLDAVEAMGRRGAAVPTVMVAANEDGLATTQVALALGRAAADRRWQVLLVEADRAAPILAAAADMDAEPLLVDLYGTLRVGLAAEGAGSLTLAPVLRDASRLAANLALNPSTPLVDDLVSAFHLVVIDGGVAEDAAAAGWTADAFVRVAARPSRRDDDAFCASFEVACSARLATILPSIPLPEPASAEAPSVTPRPVSPPSVKAATAILRPRVQPAPVATTVSAVAAPRRKIAGR